MTEETLLKASEFKYKIDQCKACLQDWHERLQEVADNRNYEYYRQQDATYQILGNEAYVILYNKVIEMLDQKLAEYKHQLEEL